MRAAYGIFPSFNDQEVFPAYTEGRRVSVIYSREEKVSEWNNGLTFLNIGTTVSTAIGIHQKSQEWENLFNHIIRISDLIYKKTISAKMVRIKS